MSVLVEQMSHKPVKGCSHAELLSMIQAEPKSRRVYVLIHNIDGPGTHRLFTKVQDTKERDSAVSLHLILVHSPRNLVEASNEEKTT